MQDIKIQKLSEIPLPKGIMEVLNFLSISDFKVYIIGGFVRDLILGNKSFDLDFILIGEEALKFAELLAEKFNGKAILLDEKSGTTRLVLKDEGLKHYSFDFTSIKPDELEKDFQRRDFSINALAINLTEPEIIIDKFNGVEDLREGKIKAIKLQNLTDDPLRMLRAFRFAALINGVVEVPILSYIKSNLSCFEVAEERIMLELWKILDSKNAYKYIQQLADIGLLEKIIPELSSCKQIPPNDFHHLGLFDHSIYLLETFEEQYEKIPERAKCELELPHGEAIYPTKKHVAKLGSLLHDIGKPDTWKIKQVNGLDKHTFIGHDKVGAEITKNISKRLKLSNFTSTSLSNLVRYHLRPYQMSSGNSPITDRALFRFYRDVGDDVSMLLILALADHYATLGPKADEEHLKYGENLILYLYDEYFKYQDKQKDIDSRPRLLDGNDIMKITGLSESPELGQIIKQLDEAISIGNIKTKDDAINWIKNRANS